MKNVFCFIAKNPKSDNVKRLQNMTSQLSGINATCIDLCQCRSNFNKDEKKAEAAFAEEAVRLYKIIKHPSFFLKMQDSSTKNRANVSSDKFMPGMLAGFVVGQSINSNSFTLAKEHHKDNVAQEKSFETLSNETVATDDISISDSGGSEGGDDGGSDGGGGCD